MSSTVLQKTFVNGFTLVAEPMEHVRSASMYLMLPSGYCYEPEEQLGLAGILAEMMSRGAGDRDSRELATAFDNLGADNNEGAGPLNLTLSASTLARNLPNVLELIADVARRPWLPEDELEAVQELSLLDLQSLDDSPSDLALLELKRRNYPAPFGRNHYGTEGGIQAITAANVKAFYEKQVGPQGAILSVAGKIDWPALVAQVEQLFGDWSKPVPTMPTPSETMPPCTIHLPKDTQQTQIALAFPSAPFGTDDFYPARGAINVLSGGMSSRLFTEVREKRGLCYSVSASYDLIKDRASVVCYAGTGADRAQQTLDVMLAELHRLKDGISDDEIERLHAGLKTSLIMQQESTSARASSIATDWFYLNRVRSFDEIGAAIDALSAKSILAYLERYPVQNVKLVTLGPKALELPSID